MVSGVFRTFVRCCHCQTRLSAGAILVWLERQVELLYRGMALCQRDDRRQSRI